MQLTEKKVLVIDASSQNLQTGILENGQWKSFLSQKIDVLEGLFAQIKETLEQAQTKLFELDCLIFCEGPGSLLGLRLAAMAIATWQALPEFNAKIYSYKSLHCAYGLEELKEQEPYAIISAFKKGYYNIWENNSIEPRLITDEELQNTNSKVYFLSQRKLRQKAPENTVELAYNIEKLPEILTVKTLFQETEKLDAWVPEQAEYIKWTPKRHTKK